MKTKFSLYVCPYCQHGSSFTKELIEEFNRKNTFTCPGCKKELTIEEAIRGLLLSSNPFVKFGLISDTIYSDNAEITVGETCIIEFPKPFKKIHKVFLTPYGYPVYLDPIFVTNKSFWIISSKSQTEPKKNVQFPG